MGTGSNEASGTHGGDERRAPGTRPGDAVGLGHVVANEAGIGDRGPDSGDAPLVEAASAESFPASDPPGFMSEPATPADPRRTDPSASSGHAWADRDTLELPSPRDVP